MGKRAGNKTKKPVQTNGKKTEPSFFKKLANFFGRYDFRDRKLYEGLGKILLFSLVVVVETLMLLRFIEVYIETKHVWLFVMFVLFGVGLALFEWLVLFEVDRIRYRLLCYFIIFWLTVALASLAGNTYLLVLFMLLLTEVYLNSGKFLSSVAVFLLGVLAYVLGYSASLFLSIGQELTALEVITQSLAAIVLLTIHFFAFRFSVGFYRQYIRLGDTLKELAESKKELQKAYGELEEKTALAERQRIAKDIHDTAGHSITTVIMQTEAAKLIIDKDPTEAKAKIVAANLQAKSALEELRKSVHVLSGVSEKEPLKSALQRIISESTDGTGIKIRSEIDDIEVNDELYRFICNTFKEGISNGIRHGGATAFWFSIKKEEKYVDFLLSDNGSGVPIGALKEGFGLTGMKREAAALNGTVYFVSEQDEGFEIHVRLPIV